VCCVSRSNDAYANWQAWSLFFGADNRTCGLAPAKLSGRYVPPGHYDIDFSRLVPERVSHVQVQLLPRIDAQLGVIEAIVDDNPKRTIREVSGSSVLEKSREQFLSAGERSHPNVHGHVPISPAEASRGRCRISAHKKNVICFPIVTARIATSRLALGAPTLQPLS